VKHALAATGQDARGDHDGAYIDVPKQLLDGPDSIAILQPVRRKALSERITAADRGDGGAPNRRLYRPLEAVLHPVMAADHLRAWIECV
jgi:hypothetical protein